MLLSVTVINCNLHMKGKKEKMTVQAKNISPELYEQQSQQILNVFENDGCKVERDTQTDAGYYDEIWYVTKPDKGQNWNVQILYVRVLSKEDDWEGWRVKLFLFDKEEKEPEMVAEMERIHAMIKELHFPVYYGFILGERAEE